jgi:hypothetical protein
MTNESDDDDAGKQNLAAIEDILEGLIQVLEILSKEESSTTTERYSNVLKIAEELTKINLSPIIDACMKEEYGLPLPVSLTSILQRICKEKGVVTKIFTKIL